MMNYKVSKIEENGNSAVFGIEPLEAGFGHTLGNCLRRVLLTSLEGAAITSIKIDGVSHQFSTITGISEDVIEIILSLKKVRINLFSDKPAKMFIKAFGKGEVKASDIDTAGNGEVVNPGLHIASLNSTSAKLNIEMTVEKGLGFVMADDKKSSELGLMSIDANFSPVVFVNYSVEQTRVGQSANYDRLVLEITTDGSVSPEDVLNSSATILSAYFKQIHDPAVDREVEVEGSAVSDSVMQMSVEELDLPVRITNALKAVEIDTVEKLIHTPKSLLLKSKNLGVQSITLIYQKLSERGLSLSEA